MKLWVVIATVGRASLLRQTVAHLMGQSRLPDGILVVGSCPDDIAGLPELAVPLEAILAPKGLCRQRNAALDALRTRAEIIVFFDDDFVPHRDYLHHADAMMIHDDNLVGATGIVLADGAQTGPIPFERGVQMLDLSANHRTAADAPCTSLYGCNMVVRMSAALGLRFDEELPLYGWQEDVDFTTRLGRRGRMLKAASLSGVHLGTRSGRQSGRRLGYSQVANVLYLLQKGTIGRWHGMSLLARNPFPARTRRPVLPDGGLPQQDDRAAARRLRGHRKGPCQGNPSQTKRMQSNTGRHVGQFSQCAGSRFRVAGGRMIRPTA